MLRVRQPAKPEARLKVLWVTPTLGVKNGGPTSTVVNGLSAENRSGIDSELATTVGPEQLPDSIEPVRRLRENGITVRLFPRSSRKDRGEAWGASLRFVFWLIRNIRRYDVIHLQYVWCLTSIAGAIAARISGIPVVVTPHESMTGFDIEVASRNPDLRMMKRLLRHLYLGSVDQLLLMSRLEERDTNYGPVPVRIVSHAVLERPVSGRARTISSDSGLRIAFLGRNIEKKGIHLILEAIAKRPERNRRVTIAGPPGDDAYRCRLESLIRSLAIEDRVDWAGYVDDRPGYLREADVLAMPSVYEGFGMVSAEAMCAGVPVVVPARSGVAEIVEEFKAGVIMPVASADALDLAFAQLEDDRVLAERMSANGLRAANERLTYESYAKQTGDVYRGLLLRSSS